ncbi:MAG: FAD-dependent oxidoreductase [Bacteroidia bacterium]
MDATYEGDLMAAAGVSYTVGRKPMPPTAKRSTASRKRIPSNTSLTFR